MSLISRMRRQTAVWWAADGSDRFGAPRYKTPVEIKCRWEDVRKEFLNSQGVTAVSNSIVYVDRLMKTGDVLFRGVLTDLTTVTVPKDNSGAFEIAAFDRLPNLKNTEELLTAYL